MLNPPRDEYEGLTVPGEGREDTCDNGLSKERESKRVRFCFFLNANVSNIAPEER